MSVPPFREGQSAEEQQKRRKAGLDCWLCGYPLRKGAVKINGQMYHARCAR